MELQELMISRDQSAGAMKGKELDLYFLHLSWDTLIGTFVGIYGNTKKHDYGNKHFTYHYGIMKAKNEHHKISLSHLFQICFIYSTTTLISTSPEFIVFWK